MARKPDQPMTLKEALFEAAFLEDMRPKNPYETRDEGIIIELARAYKNRTSTLEAALRAVSSEPNCWCPELRCAGSHTSACEFARAALSKEEGKAP
jgi:hypothetical protein